MTLRRAILLVIVALVVGAAAYWAFRPRPVAVDLAAIERGTLEVTVKEEGTTRIRDVYVVSAPVAGTVQRIPGRVGDLVEADRTLVAILRPAAPAFLDVRSRREAEAALEAASASVKLADAQLREAEADAALARSELQRLQTLASRNIISDRTLEEAQANLARAEARVASAEATVDVRKQEKEVAEARLIGPETLEAMGESSCCISVHAPVSGEILAIHQESEAVVNAGTPLVEVGDRSLLEIVAELLSSDAVRVPDGAPATIEGWGGPALEARVDRIEPAGFTEVSALGIEEQRVRAVLQLRSPPEERKRLGHGYRVLVNIVVERHEDVLLVPLGALFRQGEQWAVFVATPEDQAALRLVEIGARDDDHAVLLSGLEEGDTVILHPSDTISDGTAVESR